MTRLYIAGPMSNLPAMNYPAFHEEAARLRAMGFEVENPAENAAPPCMSWMGWMRLGLRQMLTCDEVVLLPGWRQSRGGFIEAWVARSIGMPVKLAKNVQRRTS